MIPYKFIDTSWASGYLAANVIELINNKTTTLSHRLFEEVPPGSSSTGKGEVMEKTLSCDLDGFWEAAYQELNSTTRSFESMKADKRFQDFMSYGQEGDKLIWYSWHGGPLAANAGFGIYRDDTMIAYMSLIVS